jgi:hypothetical protein
MLVEYVRQTAVRETEQGERKVAIPRKNRFRGSSSISIILAAVD